MKWRVNVAFSDDMLQAIRDRIDMVKLVRQHVALKKNGRNFVGLCPFHAEKTPSFFVSGDKGLFHCFGCHMGGDAFDFMMHYHGFNFHQAACQLASEVGLVLDAASKASLQKRQAQQQASEIHKGILDFFIRALWGPQGGEARAYLSKRGIPEAFARSRCLGFGSDPLSLRTYLQQNNTPWDERCKNWTLFAGRLVCPIRDAEGYWVGFGGRRLDDASSGGPKYINSPESALFHKHALLYGWYEAQAAIRQTQRVIVVEGYTDVWAAQRAQLPETVATLGTALTPEHVRMCKRLAGHVVLGMDADAAGRQASFRASMLILQAGLHASVAVFPKGEDPDSLFRHQGPRALQDAMKQARPAVEYFIDKSFEEPSLPIEARAQKGQQLITLLGCLQSGLERDLYMHRLAEKIGMPLHQLQRHVPTPAAARLSHPSSASSSSTSSSSSSSPGARGEAGRPSEPQAAGSVAKKGSCVSKQLSYELDLLRELLLYPSLRTRFNTLVEYVQTPQMQQMLCALSNPEACISETLRAHVDDPVWLKRLSCIQPFHLQQLDKINEKSNRTFEDVLVRLKCRHLDTILGEVLEELRIREAQGEATDHLLRRKQELTARKRALKSASVMHGQVKPAGQMRQPGWADRSG